MRHSLHNQRVKIVYTFKDEGSDEEAVLVGVRAVCKMVERALRMCVTRRNRKRQQQLLMHVMQHL